MKSSIHLSLALMIAAAFSIAVASSQILAQDTEQGAVVTAAKKQEDTEKQEEEKPKGYAFEIVKSVEATDVKSQDSTGTCWCYASASFLESELMRMGKGELNISEMFVVRNIYKQKARNFVHRQGKTNFGEGALAHDFMNAVRRHGLMPEGA